MTIAPPRSEPATRLTPGQLHDLVQRYADEVRAGGFVAEFDTEDRWHVRIRQDDQVDVWLISWTTEQGTELHDHGSSSGAFTVVSGELNEYVWSGDGSEARGVLVDNLRREGDTIAFGPDYVHDVRNHRSAPAVSVHAYSPPIRLMHFYDVSDQSLLHWASNWTDDPEAPAPDRGRAPAVGQR